MTRVVSAQAVNPCQPAVDSLGLPESRPAAKPPASAAKMPEIVHHTAAPMERPLAEGFWSAPAPGSRVDAPMPMPII